MLSKKVIIWIEDETGVLEPMVKPLDADFEIVRYRTYAEAIDHSRELRRCDLILLDAILPPGRSDIPDDDYLGLELLKKLRLEDKISTPILLYSVVAGAPEVVQKIKELDLSPPLDKTAYLDKTARPSELKQAVLELLGIAPAEP